MDIFTNNHQQYLKQLAVAVCCDSKLMSLLKCSDKEVKVGTCELKALTDGRTRRYGFSTMGIHFFLAPNGDVTAKRETNAYACFKDGGYFVQALNGNFLLEREKKLLTKQICCQPESAVSLEFWVGKEQPKKEREFLMEISEQRQTVTKTADGLFCSVLEKGFPIGTYFHMNNRDCLSYNPMEIFPHLSLKMMKRVKENYSRFLDFSRMVEQVGKAEDVAEILHKKWDSLMKNVKKDVPELEEKIDTLGNTFAYRKYSFQFAEYFHYYFPHQLPHDGWLPLLAELKTAEIPKNKEFDETTLEEVIEKARTIFSPDGKFCLTFPVEMTSWTETEQQVFFAALKPHLRQCCLQETTVYPVMFY